MMYVQLEGDVVKGAASVQSAGQIPAGALKVIASGTPEVGEVLVPGRPSVRDLCRMMLSGSALVDRPSLPVPVQSSSTVTLSGLPLGTVVEVIDASGDEVMAELVADTEGWGDDIVMASNGAYQIELLPPAPYLELSFAFEVTGL